MFQRRVIPLLAGSLLVVSGCSDSSSYETNGPAAAKAPASPGGAPGRYVVGFNGAPALSPSVVAASGGQIAEVNTKLSAMILDNVTNPAALQTAGVRYVESGFDAQLDVTATGEFAPEAANNVPEAPSTPWYASGVQWDMPAMKADKGWELTDGGAGVKVCIVDSGVDSLHQELAGKVTFRANFVTSQPRIDDPNGHGTHVAGEVAAKGVVLNGVAPRATIMSARVLNTAGSGTESAIVNGITWCADRGAHVINLSIGGIRYKGTSGFTSSPAFYGAAIKYATDSGAVVVISSGNSNIQYPNPMQITVPGMIPGVLSVGATGPTSRSTAPAPPLWNPTNPAHVWQGVDSKAFYSNFGSAVAVFAPGGRGAMPLSFAYRFVNQVFQSSIHDNIWGLCSGQTGQNGAVNSAGVPSGSSSCLGSTSKYIAYAGTSMAAPHVSGMAALLYAELGGARSKANGARVEACIRATTDNIGPSSTFGGGRVNVESGILAIRNGTCGLVPTVSQ
ncbi:MAG: S8 family peptidase [Gemmatimonas sp.]